MNDAEISSIALPVIRRLSSGGHLLLLTDYDGTLTPIVPTPDRAWLPRSVHDDLEALARSARTHVSVVSGRDLADLRERVAVAEAILSSRTWANSASPPPRARRPALPAPVTRH
jgi:trehalose 6-phosphate phosphatase